MISNTSGAPPGLDKRNGRPLATGTRSNAQLPTPTTTNVQGHPDNGQEIKAAADDAWFRVAYRLGHDAGWQLGYAYAYHEQDEHDRCRMAYMHGVIASPSYTERWDGHRSDFGRPRPGDHPGGPVDWETSRPIITRGAA